MPFYPGPGVGGHCIPLDPNYLASKAREYDFNTRFIELAAEINTRMPHYVTSRIMETLDSRGKSLKGAKVLVLGVAYKKDVADTRESPSLKLVQLLGEKGAKIKYNDPYIPTVSLAHGTLNSVKLTKENLSWADCTVIATAHTCYGTKKIAAASKLVFDCRGVTRGLSGNNIVRLGE
jgi:UDP-N-acetyl-D-glucosamine dehydrogenase